MPAAMTIPEYSSRKLIAFAAVALVVCSAPVFETRFLNDMDFYALVADKLLSGRLLYRDAMDTKPPLVFLHYALIFKLFGLDTLAAVKVVTMAWLGASALVLRALRRALSPTYPMPALATLLFVLASFSGWGEDFLSSNTEILANLFILVGVWLLVLRDFAYRPICLLAGGCSIGMACLYRYQSAAALVAYAGTIGLCRQVLDGKLTRLLLVVAGAVAPSLLVVAYYARIGALAELRLLLAYQAHYACDADALSLGMLLGRALTALAGLWPLALLAGCQIAFILKRPAPASRTEVFQVLFAVSSVSTFFVGKRFFPHYFIQAIPALVLLATERLESSCRNRAEPRSWFAAHALAIQVALAVAFTAINGIYYWTRKAPPVHPSLVAFVEANSTPADEVLLWIWQPQLLFETKRVFASRLLVNEILIGRMDPLEPRRRREGLAELWPAYLRDLEAAPPKLIFDAPPGRSVWPFEAFPPLAAFLTRYQTCQVIDDVCVYLRRD